MSKWMEDCVNNHPKCYKQNVTFMPTRLIDVRAFGKSRDVRLVLTGTQANRAADPNKDNSSSLRSYVALSHCWGPPSKQPSIKTKKTLTQHTKCIPLSDLCLSFMDAVELTAGLGQRYLWVDPLCIIQDDPADWEHEASKMSKVYENAIVTLSALSSADSTRGCRVANVQATLPGRRFFDVDAGLQRIRILEENAHDWHKEYGNKLAARGGSDRNPLRSRAWALQERELSVRIIHFSHNLILWECGTCQRTSELPWVNNPQDQHVKFHRPVPNHRNETLPASQAQTSRERWYALMEDYMSRGLTHDDDRLPALSGLAQSFQTQMSSGRYLAGLWSHHLFHSLLWRTNSPVEQATTLRPSGYRAPTWSPLSLDVPISYESPREDKFSGVEDAFQEPGSKCSTVRGFNTKPSGNDLYGALESASLEMRGAVVSLPLTMTTCLQARGEPDGAATGVVYSDVADDFTEGISVWCIAVRPEPYWGVEQVVWHLPERSGMSDDDPRDPYSVDGLVMGLVLDKVNDKHDTYRRIGMIRWLEESVFDDVPVSDFTLI